MTTAELAKLAKDADRDYQFACARGDTREMGKAATKARTALAKYTAAKRKEMAKTYTQKGSQFL